MMMTSERQSPVQAPWYWASPIRWVPFWDANFGRWLVIAESGGRGVFYIWLTKGRDQREDCAREVAEALTRVYRV